MAEQVVKIESDKENLNVVVEQHKKLVNNFTAGMAFGVGSAIGATFIFGIILFFLSQLNTVPLVGQYIENIINYLQNQANP